MNRPLRRPASVAAVVGLLAGVVLAIGTGARAQVLDLPIVSVDPSGYPEMRMLVAAPAPFGGRTLESSSFTLAENGEPRDLEVQALPDEGVEIALVIDTSGSMQGAAMEAAKAAAQSLLDQLPAAVPVSVIGFGPTPAVLTSRSTDEGAQAASVGGLQPSGETALYDAVTAAAEQLSGSSARRFAVILSDGGDTVSQTTLGATAAALARERIGVLVVSLQTAESNTSALGALAAPTAGTVVAASDPNALAGAFDAVSALLVRQYELRWQTTSSGITEVSVTLASGDLRAETVRSIDIPVPAGALGPAAEASGATEGAGVTDAASRPAGAAAPSSSAGSGWIVWVGALLIGVAVVAAAIAFFVPGVPRARGIPRRNVATREALQGLTERAGAAATRVMSAAQETFLGRWLERAGLDLRPGEFIVIVGAATLGVFALVAVTVSLLAAVIAAGLTVLAAKIVVDLLAHRRQAHFADQLADVLLLMSGTLRAGYGTAQAIEAATRESEWPTADEFRRLVIESRLGRDFTDAMRAMADRVGSQDLEWVVQAFEIHAEVGGDLAEVLDTVANTIRERNRVRNQIKVLSAEGILSGIILFALPVVVAAILTITNPNYLDELFGTGRGQVMLTVAIALQLLGGVWLRQLVKPRF